MIIVIDGPAGSGKSSTAKAIANRLNIQFLDSGALYRALTLLWLDRGSPDKATFFENLSDVKISAEYRNNLFHVNLNGNNVTEEIRSQRVADSVSEIATHPEARKHVNNIMRQMVNDHIYIADGRDLGTAVFPNAELKFYMDASIEERAKRRFNEMHQNNSTVTLDEIKQNLKKRDQTDMNRKTDPLKKAEDAVVIDTTGKTFEEQVTEMIGVINSRIKS